MSDTMICDQKDCEDEAVYRYTWPGRDEAGACECHALGLCNLARAMGWYLQLIPLRLEETTDDE